MINFFYSLLNALQPRKPNTQQVIRPSVMGLQTVWDEGLGRLTPQQLSAILANAEQGDIREFLIYAQEMEEQDPHYAAVLSTRKLAVAGLVPNVISASDDESDVYLTDLIRELIIDNPAFNPMLIDALDAVAKGFSVVEIMWNSAQTEGSTLWIPTKYQYHFPQWFCFDRDNGRDVRLIDGSFDGIQLEPNKFIIHTPSVKSGLPIRNGVARTAALTILRKNHAIRHYMVFSENFYSPVRLGKYDVRTTNANELDVLKRAVRDIGSDAAAVVPDSMNIEFIQPPNTANGSQAFENLINMLNSEITKLVLKQTMTTENGSSLAQANVHNEVRKEVIAFDAKQLAATLNRDLIRPFIDLNFGKQKKYPVLSFDFPESRDLTALSANLEKLVPLGLTVETSVVRDLFGLPEPTAGADVLKPAMSPIAQQVSLNRAQQSVAADINKFPLLSPIIEEIESADDYASVNFTKLANSVNADSLHEALTIETFKKKVDAYGI